MTIEEIIEVLQACKNGETIQQQSKHGYYNEKWYDSANPTWNHVAFSYRVKPKPMEAYITVYRDEDAKYGGAYISHVCATNYLSTSRPGKVVKFIEVIE